MISAPSVASKVNAKVFHTPLKITALFDMVVLYPRETNRTVDNNAIVLPQIAPETIRFHIAAPRAPNVTATPLRKGTTIAGIQISFKLDSISNC